MSKPEHSIHGPIQRRDILGGVIHDNYRQSLPLIFDYGYYICTTQDEIERLPQVIALSRKTFSVIRLNVIFSMGMSSVAVILGGFGVIDPVIGAVMHELSTLPELANSSHIINYQIQKEN